MHTNNPFTERKRAALGAMTAAVKAQMELHRVGVPATVVQLDPKETRHGCAFGVEFAAEDFDNGADQKGDNPRDDLQQKRRRQNRDEAGQNGA